MSRKKIAIINILLMLVLCLPCIFSLNIWEDIKVFGKNFMDLEDFAVSNVLLPLGSLFYVLFCTTRYGWGFNQFFAEVNTGKGLKFPLWLRPYVSYVLPLIIIVIFIMSVI